MKRIFFDDTKEILLPFGTKQINRQGERGCITEIFMYKYHNIRAINGNVLQITVLLLPVT